MVMPVYQKAGVQIASIPQMTTVGLQERGRTAETLSAAIDRVSSFAFKKAEVQAQIEGAEYGALNAPSYDEVKDLAKQTPEQIQETLKSKIGDRTTVFGQAAYKAAMTNMITEFEMEANTLITEARAKFEREEITAAELASEIDSVGANLGSVLMNVDPATATEFRKAVATAGNSAFLSALGKEQTRNKNKREVASRLVADQLIDGVEGQVTSLVEDIIRAGDTEDENGERVLPEDKIEATIRRQLANIAYELGDPAFFNTYSERLDKAVSQAKIDVVSEYIIQDPLDMIDQLDQTGSFEGDQQVKDLYSRLTTEERAAVRDKVDNYIDEQQAEADQRENRDEKQRAKNILNAEISAHQAIIANDPDAIEEQLAILDRLSPDKATSYRKVAEGGGGQFDKADVVKRLSIERVNGRLSAERINKAFTDREITRSTYDSMMGHLFSQGDRRYQDGLRVLKNAMGYPEYDSIAMGAVQRTAVRDLAKIENEYYALREAAIKAGETPPDPFTWFSEKAADANKYPPEQREADIEVITTYFDFNQFTNYGDMRNDANRRFQAGNLDSETYGRLEEAFTNVFKYNLEYGEFEREQ